MRFPNTRGDSPKCREQELDFVSPPAANLGPLFAQHWLDIVCFVKEAVLVLLSPQRQPVNKVHSRSSISQRCNFFRPSYMGLLRRYIIGLALLTTILGAKLQACARSFESPLILYSIRGSHKKYSVQYKYLNCKSPLNSACSGQHAAYPRSYPSRDYPQVARSPPASAARDFAGQKACIQTTSFGSSGKRWCVS